MTRGRTSEKVGGDGFREVTGVDYVMVRVVRFYRTSHTNLIAVPQCQIRQVILRVT